MSKANSTEEGPAKLQALKDLGYTISNVLEFSAVDLMSENVQSIRLMELSDERGVPASFCYICTPPQMDSGSVLDETFESKAKKFQERIQKDETRLEE